jgi:hypothetical protein
MNAPSNDSSRQRLKELLAIPDRLRTEEQWDELIELEIMLAPGNREGAPDPKPRRPGPPNAAPARHNGGGGGPKKPFRKFHKKPAKPPAT